jgi:hypothetical protein
VSGPGSAARDVRLARVAAWDPPLLRGAVSTLAAVVARLSTLRLHLEAVGRSLEDAQCWSGPAARSAAAAVAEVGAVATAVQAAFADSAGAFGRLAGHAEQAHEFAVRALVLQVAEPAAGGSGSALFESLGLPAPAPVGAQMAAAALEEADAAGRAAHAAADALFTPFAGPPAGPLDFPQLAEWVAQFPPVAVAAVPPTGDPVAIARWWSGLPEAVQLVTIRAHPTGIGRLDGIPAWARDRANRLVLGRALSAPGTPAREAALARAVAARISAEEGTGQRVQLQELDLPGDLVVLALGDLDSAAAVAVLVPGIRTTPEDDLGSQVDDARHIATAARAAAPGLPVAGVVWLGYRTPGFLGALSRDAAERGGPELDVSLRGLAAARPASGHDRARTSVVAHSYGTVVAGEAAEQPGRLEADAVVLLGSPGMPGDAHVLEAPEVYDAATLLDPVAISQWFGTAPSEREYGATELPVDPFAGHTDYYDPTRPTVPAIGAVVAGTEGRH